jgi:Domain of unknown function (DUF4926)
MPGVLPKEHDMVVLLVDLPQYQLAAGDLGAVVHCYNQPGVYEVEFVDGAGATRAIVTLEAQQILKLNWAPAASA